MPQTCFRAAAPLLLLFGMNGSAFVSASYAGQQPDRVQELRPRTPSAPSAQDAGIRDGVGREIDAEATRRALIDVLRKHPPAVARILKLDPSLMRNDSYLAPYPTLREFLAEHPEIPQNAGYYFEPIYGVDHGEPPNPRVRLIEGTLAGLGGFATFIIVLCTLIWLTRTTLEQRRWNRLSKIQAEVHSKLMDRFSSNDELITYVQTPSGRRFLESGPSPLQESPLPRAMAAPFSRILWSVQIGIVMIIAGLGLLFVSTRTVEEAHEFFFVFGSLAMALGAGFTVSAAASYVLSRKFGLFDPPAADRA